MPAMTGFEKKLKWLFDAQDFFRNTELDNLIKRETVRELSDDALDMLFAAGDPSAANEKKDGQSDGKK